MDVVSYALSRKYHDRPIASYTVTGNKEVVATAVDVDTDTFTAVAHGFNDTNIVSLVPNIATETGYLGKYYPGGVTADSYYVVNKTNDTFQLSLTSGGAAINITANATMDLSKLHFETELTSVVISSLPSLRKCRVLIRGRNKSASSYVYPNGVEQNQNWTSGAGTTFGYGNSALKGVMQLYCEYIIDYTGYLTLFIRGQGISPSTSSANIVTHRTDCISSPIYRDGTITSLTLFNWGFLNGTTIEVYKV